MNKLIKENLNLDDLLEEISVFAPGQWENEEGPKEWFAVCDDEGIIAYFRDESHAFHYRLILINFILNNLSKGMNK